MIALLSDKDLTVSIHGDVDVAKALGNQDDVEGKDNFILFI